ncbi:uncharacterized protein isoform X2 [Rhodnius prolixus]|uniref:uncharacterized protein isoform X2 n=1 Tax=Rhodnius prolixus TaxID=13249 RepID=UPI003D188EBB
MNEESHIFMEASDKSSKTLRICPTCLGKGFFEEPIRHSEEIIGSREAYSLPKIIKPMKVSDKSTKQSTRRKNDIALPILPSRSTPCSRHSYMSRSFTNCTTVERLPQLKRDSSQVSKDSGDSQKDYTIGKREITDLVEFAKATKIQLKSVNMDDIATGVINTVHIARQDSDVALAIMPQVNRQICTLLKSMKLYHILIAIEVVKELYSTIPLISRPEFDEMIHLLLAKVSDLKSNVRDEANAALDIVAANTPPQYIVRAVIGKGPNRSTCKNRE